MSHERKYFSMYLVLIIYLTKIMAVIIIIYRSKVCKTPKNEDVKPMSVTQGVRNVFTLIGMSELSG